MLWNGRMLTLKATLVSERDHGNLVFDLGGPQVALPHLALIGQDVIDRARAVDLVVSVDWLEAQCPLEQTMALDATVVNVRDLSNVVVRLGRSADARQVTLDHHVIHRAAGLDEPLGAAASAPPAPPPAPAPPATPVAPDAPEGG